MISLKPENRAREGGEQHDAFWFSQWLHICFFLFTMFFMLTLGSTKKSCVAQKTFMSTEKIFHIEVNVVQQNYVSHTKKYVVATKKIMWHPKKKFIV